MRIDIYCVKEILNLGEPMQMAACAIRLVASDGSSRIERKMAFALGNSTPMRASIQMLRLVLASVQPSYRHCEVLIHNDEELTYNLLCKIAKRYQFDYDELFVKELRLVADTFKNLYVMSTDKSELAEMYSMARECAATQKNVDING